MAPSWQVFEDGAPCGRNPGWPYNAETGLRASLRNVLLIFTFAKSFYVSLFATYCSLLIRFTARLTVLRREIVMCLAVNY